MEIELKKAKKAKVGYLLAGYILSPLGGIIGLWIGLDLFVSTVKDSTTKKRKRYDKVSRIHGFIMVIISLFAMAICRSYFASK